MPAQINDFHVFFSNHNFRKEHIISETIQKKKYELGLADIKKELSEVTHSLSETSGYVKLTTKTLRGRRHYLEASLNSLIRQYDNRMLKYQLKLKEHEAVEAGNAKDIEKLQKRFKDVEETYDEMRAMRRLKELLKNMEKAEAIKQNWAARKIQVGNCIS